MTLTNAQADLVFDPDRLRRRVIDALSSKCGLESLFNNQDCRYGARTSSVLLLLGEHVFEDRGAPEACVILNKRSKLVKQPGDLCCPGGAIEKFDHLLARLLSIRVSKWPCWKTLKEENSENTELLLLLYAAGLRESWEEMRLNPFGLTFLGPLPSQCLILYRRVIHPMVAWVIGQREFTLSWEVERIVRFPLRALLNPYNYANYRVYVPPHLEWRFRGRTVDTPCFVYRTEGRAELLWGATFRIVALFMELIFGFRFPEDDTLPLIPAFLGDEYVNGNSRRKDYLEIEAATG